MSGAEPWTGSNIDGHSRSGLKWPDGAMPIDPATAASEEQQRRSAQAPVQRRCRDFVEGQ
jgi:hypothetical protein